MGHELGSAGEIGGDPARGVAHHLAEDAEHGEQRLHGFRRHRLVERDPDGGGVDATEVDAPLGGGRDDGSRGRHLDGQGVEPGVVVDDEPTLGQGCGQGRGEPVHPRRDLDEAFRPVVHAIHAGDVGQQHLGGADVGRRLFPTDVLLPGLQDEPQRHPAFGVLGDTHHPSWELPLVLVAGGYEGGVGAAEHHRNPEPLRRADHDVGAHLARRGEQGESEQVGGDCDQRPSVVEAGDQLGVVANRTSGSRVLQQHAEGPLRQVVLGVGDNHLEPERPGTGIHHIDRLWVGRRIDDEHHASLPTATASLPTATASLPTATASVPTATARAAVDPLQHRHRLGGGGALVEQGGVGDVHAGEVRHHRLEVEQRLEPTLGDLGLVGRVGGVPARVLQQIAADHRRQDGAVVAHPDQRGEHLVLVGEPAQLVQRLGLGERAWQVVALLAADDLGDGPVDELLHGSHPDDIEHVGKVRWGGSEVAVGELAATAALLGGGLGHGCDSRIA